MRDVIAVIALAVSGVVAVAASVWYGRNLGSRKAQDDATAATERRCTSLEGMVSDLEAARERDRDDFNRRISESERMAVASERQCERKLSHLQGQLDVLKGGIVKDVGRELAQSLRAHDDDFAEHVATRVVDRINGGGR